MLVVLSDKATSLPRTVVSYSSGCAPSCARPRDSRAARGIARPSSPPVPSKRMTYFTFGSSLRRPASFASRAASSTNAKAASQSRRMKTHSSAARSSPSSRLRLEGGMPRCPASPGRGGGTSPEPTCRAPDPPEACPAATSQTRAPHPACPTPAGNEDVPPATWRRFLHFRAGFPRCV